MCKLFSFRAYSNQLAHSERIGCGEKKRPFAKSLKREKSFSAQHEFNNITNHFHWKHATSIYEIWTDALEFMYAPEYMQTDSELNKQVPSPPMNTRNPIYRDDLHWTARPIYAFVLLFKSNRAFHKAWLGSGTLLDGVFVSCRKLTHPLNRRCGESVSIQIKNICSPQFSCNHLNSLNRVEQNPINHCQ